MPSKWTDSHEKPRYYKKERPPTVKFIWPFSIIYYHPSKKFIVTEWPKQPTLDSFWTLIFDHNVHTVICLTNQPTDNKANNSNENKYSK